MPGPGGAAPVRACPCEECRLVCGRIGYRNAYPVATWVSLIWLCWHSKPLGPQPAGGAGGGGRAVGAGGAALVPLIARTVPHGLQPGSHLARLTALGPGQVLTLGSGGHHAI